MRGGEVGWGKKGAGEVCGGGEERGEDGVATCTEDVSGEIGGGGWSKEGGGDGGATARVEEEEEGKREGDQDFDAAVTLPSSYPIDIPIVAFPNTNCGADDKAYKCVYEDEDKDGKLGVTLSKDLMSIAGEALKSNITALSPLVLPLSEQLMFCATLMARKIFKLKKINPYICSGSQASFRAFLHPRRGEGGVR
ncbi:hypothetical protein ACJIZ3_016451 [Penstemon smallii]|uniref:FAE domain-containing protein n=1 Tax=Penstemon smallii TaxID=265156 RepID=A0ABD3RQN2_9LAMI